jgi:CO dehydrogenase maturation factor
MKIIICGKGGSGKSTVAASLAKNLQSAGYRVLVVDTDESNFGLSVQLGLKDPQELMEQIGGKRAVQNKMGRIQPSGEKAPVFSDMWHIGDIPAECISGKDNLYLLQIGKVKHFGEGCACPMGVLSKDFLSHLVLDPNDVAIIDTEAGVEHLGRGVAASADLIFGVIDPSYESIRLSEKITAMAQEAKKPVYFILNKMDEAFVAKIMPKIGKEHVLGAIPFSRAAQEKGLTGEPLDFPLPGMADITAFVLGALKKAKTKAANVTA